ncbi:tautomerase family protein [Novosphingobium flavum]|uniref:Tautomerase family protein n=1 Tax=Novosphingobium flavum TaxID=1778672 RepID=A0A7X1FTE8_9SPHN|nr:tautomerase family protein [Novosphingobium flavum]MBC2666646.1 tautomerase family protein [Novosphingobium flavum]
MPEVIIYAAAGRTVEQKRGLVKDITTAFDVHFKSPPKNIVIQIVECPEENKAKGGELFCDAERRKHHQVSQSS